MMDDSVSGARLLVLGAGLFQLAGIRRALELGCEVTTVDNVPGNSGHRLAHRSFNVSTTDMDGVLDLAKGLNIDGVVTFASDIAALTVAMLREEIGRSGPGPESVQLTTNKAAFRERQRRSGLLAPRTVVVDCSTNGSSDGLELPVIVKPVDSSGSRGVGVGRVLDDLPELVTSALAQSRSGQVVVEEFVRGREVGGDVFLVDGEIVGGGITNKHLDGFLVAGHDVPSTLSGEDQRRVLEVVKKTCQAVNVLNGPVNFDVIIDTAGSGDITILELSPRTGGNGIPEIIELSTGFDLYEATIRHALGRPVNTTKKPSTVICAGSVVFGGPTAGRLRRIANPPFIGCARRKVNEIWLRNKVGDVVRRFSDVDSIVGYLIFECESSADYVDALSDLPNAVSIEVDEGVFGQADER